MIGETRGTLRRFTRPRPRPVAVAPRRIIRREDVWSGKAVIAGTRIPVFMVHMRLQAGWTADEIRESYPRLTAADVAAVIRYARTHSAHLAEDLRGYERALASADVG